MSEAPCHAVGIQTEHNKAPAASTMQILQHLVFGAYVASITTSSRQQSLRSACCR
jgi:hypothetical protein